MFTKISKKKYMLVIFLLTTTLILAGCSSLMGDANKEDGPKDEGDFVDPEGVLLRGNFNNEKSYLQATNTEQKDVAKVLLIYKTGYEIQKVKDGEFAIDMEKDEPAGMAFLDKNDRYLGFLTLGDGLDSIPPEFIDEETEIIDFGNITFDGDKAIPENDPVGEEIDITDSEKNLLAASSSLFSASLRSPDVVEFLMKENITWFELILYYDYAKFDKWEWEDSKTITFESIYNDIEDSKYNITYPFFQAHNFGIRIKDVINSEDNMNLSYPGEWPNVDEVSVDFDDSYNFFEEIKVENIKTETGTAMASYPPAGEYTLDLGTDNYQNINFEIPGNLNEISLKNAFLVIPSLHLKVNPDGIEIVDKISWKYMTYEEQEIDSDVASQILMDEGFNLNVKLEDKKGNIINEDIYVGVDDKSYKFEENIVWDSSSENKKFKGIGINFENLYGIYYSASFANTSSHSPERNFDNTYSIDFIINNQSGDPLEGAEIYLNGTSKTTNNSGKVTFSNLNSKIYEFEISHPEYNKINESSIEISGQDVTKEVTYNDYADYEVNEVNADVQIRNPEQDTKVTAEIANKSNYEGNQDLFLRIYPQGSEELIYETSFVDFVVAPGESKIAEFNFNDSEMGKIKPGNYLIKIESEQGSSNTTEITIDKQFETTVSNQDELEYILNSLHQENEGTIILEEGNYEDFVISDNHEFSSLTLTANKKHETVITTEIGFDTTQNITLKNLIIENSDNHGVVMNSSENINIENNIIRGNNKSGVFVMNNSKATIENNEISNNKKDGIQSDGSTLEVISNTILNNGSKGLSIHGGSTATIKDNEIGNQSNDYSQGIGFDNSDVDINDNNIHDNTMGIVYSNIKAVDYGIEKIVNNQFNNNDIQVIHYVESQEKPTLLKNISEKNTFEPESDIVKRDDLGWNIEPIQ